jgi:polyisoprenoid-binding protein YceI
MLRPLFKTVWTALVTLLVTGVVLSQSSLKPVPEQSQVNFSLRHLTGRADGHFKTYEGKLDFRPKNPDQSHISFDIDVTSIDTNNRKRDEHLIAEDYFDASRYPKMSFSSSKFHSTGNHQFVVTGPLTIKGHTKVVSVPVTLKRNTTLWATGQASLVFEAHFAIDRTEFGVGENSSLLGSEVSIDLELEFRDAH